MENCDLIIKGKYVLLVDNAMSIIENGAVAISSSEIIDLCKESDLMNKYSATRVMDAGNSIVMPGLINCHTHIAMSYFRGLADDLPLDKWLNEHVWPAEAKNVNPEFVKKAAQLSCQEMILSGTTCFNDMYFFEEQVAEAAQSLGMRAVIGEGILNFPTPSCVDHEKAIEKTIQLLEKYKNNELIKASFAPHSIYTCNKKILTEITELANKYQTRIHIHVSETKKEVEDCELDNNASPVKFLNDHNILSDNVIAVHSVWLNDEDIGIYKEKNVKVVHCPISNMKLASGAAPVAKMMKNDISVGIGTDGPASNNTQDMLLEMRVAALLHKLINNDPTVMTAREVVRMATIDGARVLGLERSIGSLEAGKKADIITIGLDKPHLTPIFDPYSHLVYAVKGSDVDNVIINGNIVMENRKLGYK